MPELMTREQIYEEFRAGNTDESNFGAVLVDEMADEILRLRAECERKDADLKHYRNELLEARDEERRARRAMHLNGLVRCDSPACNCGSYHPTTPGAPIDGE